MKTIDAVYIMVDAEETFNADKRDEFNGRNTVEQINEAARTTGGITEPEYQRNKVALNKYAF